MSKRICPECGCPITDDTLKNCPECGFVLEAQNERQAETSTVSASEHTHEATEQGSAVAHTPLPIVGKMTHCPDCGADISIRAYRCPHCGSMTHPDLGNAVYEAFWMKYATFTGRSRRAEFFPFFAVFCFLCGLASWGDEQRTLIFILPVIIPFLAVSVRRLHDIGRSGWWILCPVVPLFFYFKDSDEAENEYGKSPKYQQ